MKTGRTEVYLTLKKGDSRLMLKLLQRHLSQSIYRLAKEKENEGTWISTDQVTINYLTDDVDKCKKFIKEIQCRGEK